MIHIWDHMICVHDGPSSFVMSCNMVLSYAWHNPLQERVSGAAKRLIQEKDVKRAGFRDSAVTRFEAKGAASANQWKSFPKCSTVGLTHLSSESSSESSEHQSSDQFLSCLVSQTLGDSLKPSKRL